MLPRLASMERRRMRQLLPHKHPSSSTVDKAERTVERENDENSGSIREKAEKPAQGRHPGRSLLGKGVSPAEHLCTPFLSSDLLNTRELIYLHNGHGNNSSEH